MAAWRDFDPKIDFNRSQSRFLTKIDSEIAYWSISIYKSTLRRSRPQNRLLVDVGLETHFLVDFDLESDSKSISISISTYRNRFLSFVLLLAGGCRGAAAGCLPQGPSHFSQVLPRPGHLQQRSTCIHAYVHRHNVTKRMIKNNKNTENRNVKKKRGE